MLTPDVFIARWDETKYPLIRYNKSIVAQAGLSSSVSSFLIETGIPETAPPFLTFRTLSTTDLANKSIMPGLFHIGYTANGDYICIKVNDGVIVMVDHESSENSTFMNSSLQQMLESLLEYVDFIKKIQSVNGRRAFIDNNAPPEMVMDLRKRLFEIDSAAVDTHCFWDEELSHYK